MQTGIFYVKLKKDIETLTSILQQLERIEEYDLCNICLTKINELKNTLKRME